MPTDWSYTGTPEGVSAGFFDGPSQGANPYEGLTDEQIEDVIAEYIFDWWISGKSYKQWYAEKFLQTKFEFNDEQEQDNDEQTT